VMRGDSNTNGDIKGAVSVASIAIVFAGWATS